ncbi:uncharacterized protein LOC128671595 isoform X2 [Plodia interpunctella]|uniref:uncharacterized protein LOC128671595 isoform X2 n=1 Tax=Plodia interpunctella TaxID=58824 RepID=UPI002368CD58|nr:uncharacterized protein LOC128671595 isoform X2 [Plodia interpunctella]
MAQYLRWCLIIVTALGIASCNGQSSIQDRQMEDSTPPSLMREVEDNSRYKTLEANATLLKLLVDNKDGVSKSEVFDMLHSRDDDQSHVDLPVFPEDAEDSRVDVPSAPDSQVETLQAPSATVRKDSMRARYSSRGEPVGTAAGIMVVITCTIVCLGYIGVVVWRRIYLKRNGLKHELLRNEENIAETRIEL